MKAKSLNNKAVQEFLDTHAFSKVGSPRLDKYTTTFMVMKGQEAWIEFETYGGYCTSFCLGNYSISGRDGGIQPKIIISMQQ